MKWRTTKERTERINDQEEDRVSNSYDYPLEYLSESGTIDIDTCETKQIWIFGTLHYLMYKYNV